MKRAEFDYWCGVGDDAHLRSMWVEPHSVEAVFGSRQKNVTQLLLDSGVTVDVAGNPLDVMASLDSAMLDGPAIEAGELVKRARDARKTAGERMDGFIEDLEGMDPQTKVEPWEALNLGLTLDDAEAVFA